jgi:hypothetical protein
MFIHLNIFILRLIKSLQYVHSLKHIYKLINIVSNRTLSKFLLYHDFRYEINFRRQLGPQLFMQR